MHKNILLLLSLFFVILSCKKEVVPFITISKSELAVSDAGGVEMISFDTNVDWTVRSSDTWTTITKTSGDPSIKSISVAIAPNDTFDARSSTLTIMAGGLSKSIIITQKANLGLFTSVDKFQLSNEATTIDVVVEANVEYDVTIFGDWITRTATRGLSSTKFSFNIAKNSSYDNREGSIVIKQKGGALEKIVRVYQSQVDALILSNKKIEVSGESQTIEVELKTNVDFEVIIPEIAKSWVSYIGTRALKTETLRLNIARNNTPDTRSTEIYIKNRATSLQDTLTIIQEGGLALPVIEGSRNSIQYIEALQDFTFRLNGLDKKDVYFIFTNKNTDESTILPHIESTFVPTKTENRFAISSESSFVVPGKPSITEFNNSPWNQPKDAMSNPQYQRYVASKPERLEIGLSENLFDDLGEPHLSTVRKVISAHGKNLYVWVANDCWEAGSSKKNFVTQEMVDAFAPKFLNPGTDNDIYEWVTNAAGVPWGNTGYNNLIPDTDNIHIWLTDIGNDNTTSGTVTTGYFYARDNFLKKTYKDSNERLMFAIDAVLFSTETNGKWDMSHYWPMEIISTLSHEFTHMIYFYQKSILKDQDGNTAVNEMCAQCIEDLVANKILAVGPRGVAYATPNSGSTGNRNGRLPLYNSHNDYNLLDWSSEKSDVLINYSKTYALGSYLMRNYGGANFIKELIQNNATGVSSIVAAVNANGGEGLDYGDILQRFGVANLLSNSIQKDSGYIYNTGGWSTSTVNGITYQLGSINLYNYSPSPYIFNELPKSQKAGSNIFYRAGNKSSGSREWHIEGMSADTKMTVVIK